MWWPQRLPDPDVAYRRRQRRAAPPLIAHQSIRSRYHRHEAVQLPVNRWHAYLNDPTLADAILDRIGHGSHRIELKGDSMQKTKQILLIVNI